MDENLCVSCGEVIPEGQQVCPKCAARKETAYYSAVAYQGNYPMFSTTGTLSEVNAWSVKILSTEKTIHKVEFERVL